MSDYINLLGAEQVANAAGEIVHAAHKMHLAANLMNETLQINRTGNVGIARVATGETRCQT